MLVGLPSPRRALAPPTYLQRLRSELDAHSAQYQEVLEHSSVHNVDPNRGGRSSVIFVGYPRWGWVPSDAALETWRMALLRDLRSCHVRFRLLFTDPVPSVSKRIEDHLGLLERWLVRRSGERGVPSTVGAARAKVQASVKELHRLLDCCPPTRSPSAWSSTPTS